MLKQYGIEKVEDMPVNYRGLLAVEGEKLTSKLFDEYANRQFAQQKAQSGFADAAGLISPTLALRRVSMALAGTDLESHRRFSRNPKPIALLSFSNSTNCRQPP
jgi:ABC-2 type transport system permease protein